MISQRTSAGLQAAKGRGNQQVADANHAAAKARAEALRPVLTELAGMSANAIAKALNERGVATPTGSPWSAKTVSRVQRRLKGAS
jgi:DNA invertase Pin-like site-specific DNA recombinase